MHILSKKKIYKNTYLIVTSNIDRTNNFLIEKLKEITNKKKANLLISGGNTLNNFLKKISKDLKLLQLVKIYLTDERLVRKSSYSSNQRRVSFYLKNSKKRKKNYHLILDKSVSSMKMDFLKKINLLYPSYEKFPLAIMGVGSDGHIASIFHTDSYTKKSYKNFFIVNKKGEKYDRASLNLNYLSKLPNIIFIIQDLKKNIILKSIIKMNNKSNNYPILELINKSRGNIYIVTTKYFMDRL